MNKHWLQEQLQLGLVELELRLADVERELQLLRGGVKSARQLAAKLGQPEDEDRPQCNVEWLKYAQRRSESAAK